MFVGRGPPLDHNKHTIDGHSQTDITFNASEQTVFATSTSSFSPKCYSRLTCWLVLLVLVVALFNLWGLMETAIEKLLNQNYSFKFASSVRSRHSECAEDGSSLRLKCLPSASGSASGPPSGSGSGSGSGSAAALLDSLSLYEKSMHNTLIHVLDSYEPMDTGAAPPLASSSLFHFALFHVDRVYRHACSPRFDVSALGLPLRPSKQHTFMNNLLSTQSPVPPDYDHSYIPGHVDPALLNSSRHHWFDWPVHLRSVADAMQLAEQPQPDQQQTNYLEQITNSVWNYMHESDSLSLVDPHGWPDMYQLFMNSLQLTPDVYAQLLNIGYWYSLAPYPPHLLNKWTEYSPKLRSIVEQLRSLPSHPADLFNRPELPVSNPPLFSAALPVCSSSFLRRRTLSTAFFRELEPSDPNSLPNPWFNQLQHIWMLVPNPLQIQVPLREAHAQQYQAEHANEVHMDEKKPWQTRFGFRDCFLPSSSATFCLKCLIGKKIMFRGDSITRYQFIELVWFLHFGEHIPQVFSDMKELFDGPNPVHEWSYPGTNPSASDQSATGDIGPMGHEYVYRWRHYFYFFAYMFGSSFQLRDPAVVSSGNAPTWIKCQLLLYTHPLLDIEVSMSFQAGLRKDGTQSWDEFYSQQFVNEISYFHPSTPAEHERRERVKRYSARWLSRRAADRSMYTHSVDAVFAQKPDMYPSPQQTPLPEGLHIITKQQIDEELTHNVSSFQIAQRLLHDITGVSVDSQHIDLTQPELNFEDIVHPPPNSSSTPSSPSVASSKMDSQPLPDPLPLSVAPYDCSSTWCPDVLIANFGVWVDFPTRDGVDAHEGFLNTIGRMLPNMFYVWKSTTLQYNQLGKNQHTERQQHVIAKQIYQHRHRAAYLDMRRISGAYSPPESNGFFPISVPPPGWDSMHFHAHVNTAANNVLMRYMCDENAQFILKVTSREDMLQQEANQPDHL